MDETVGKMCEDIGTGRSFLKGLIVQELTSTLDRWDLMKSKNFCIAKETLQYMKEMHANLHSILANFC